MRRIGIAASKMSKGGLLSYNLYVVSIASLFSLLIFLICGFTILLVLFLLSLFLHTFKPDFHGGLAHIFKICLLILGIVIGIFNLIAIGKNLQLTKTKI